jgi:type II secretory pathway pseudopilin PulG
MKFKSSTNGGFSLIETLLYLGIMSVAVVAISAVFLIILQASIKYQAITEVNAQGTQVLQLMTQSIRNAKLVNSPTQGTSGSTLSINTNTSTNNPTIFDLSGGIIRIKEGSSSAVPLTNSQITVSNLIFLNLTNSIKIQFTLNYKNPENRNEYNYKETFYGTANVRPN